VLVRALDAARHARADRAAVVERHEIAHGAADHVGGADAEHLRELVVAVDEDAAVRDRRFPRRWPRQALEALLALAQRVVRALALDRRPDDGGRRLERLDLGHRPLAVRTVSRRTRARPTSAPGRGIGTPTNEREPMRDEKPCSETGMSRTSVATGCPASIAARCAARPRSRSAHAVADALVVEPHLVAGPPPGREKTHPRRAVGERRPLAEPGAGHLGRLAEPGEHLVGPRAPAAGLQQARGRERHRLEDAAAPLAVELRALLLRDLADAEPELAQAAVGGRAEPARAQPARAALGERVLLLAVDQPVAGANEVADCLVARRNVGRDEILRRRPTISRRGRP
jgi:hypothetical protein